MIGGYKLRELVENEIVERKEEGCIVPDYSERLKNADDAVCTGFLLAVEHSLLLLIHLYNSMEAALLVLTKGKEQVVWLFGYEIPKSSDTQIKAFEKHPHRLVHQSLSLAFPLDGF